MGLNREMVAIYLEKTASLTAIDNHHVKDDDGRKDGQTPLTIEVAKDCIDNIMTRDEERDEPLLTKDEWNSLCDLSESLDSIPLSMSISTLMSITSNLESIQKNLFNHVTSYVASIENTQEHLLLLKAVVLVLKIFEYDLSKKEGPITIGLGFFSKEVLSNEARIENHTLVSTLLGNVIEQFDRHYESSTECAVCS